MSDSQSDLPESYPLARDLIDGYATGTRNFSGRRWERVSVPNCELTGATFDSAHFTDCILAGSHFKQGSFKGARFERCNLIQCQFDESDLTDASFRPSVLRQSSFYMANLVRTDLSECDVSSSSFIGARLLQTPLVSTKLTGSLFGMTAIKGVNLLFADLSEVQHAFQSIIDDETIAETASYLSLLATFQRSGGAFAASLGLSPEEISYVESLLPSLLPVAQKVSFTSR